MKILAIHDGHTGTACLFEDGKIIGMASEERFTKIKNQGGFPKKTIKWLLESSNTNPKDLDFIVFAGYIMPIKEVNAHNRHRHKIISNASKYIPSKVLTSSVLTDAYIQNNRAKREKLDYYNDEFSELGLDRNKARFIEHHTCHAATAYYLDWAYKPERKTLVFTLDGSGDGLSATVSIGHNNKLERIKKIHSFNSLGMIYSRTTALLGMKPLEHEYKLMGMAPYSPGFLTEKAYEVYKNYIQLDKSGLSFENISGVYGNQLIKKLHKDMYLVRFDAICAGLQQLTEELALKWILNWVKETGIKDITLAGGVFMNVKLNMLINETKEINSVFFMPSGGDESIALGAALQLYSEEKKGEPLNIQKLENLYFGPEYSDEEIKSVLEKQNKFKYKRYDDINSKVVECIMDSKIIGRANGRMEFGARSLGNRSILSNPQNYEIVSKINRAIKMRDFWMPFAPSILDSSTEKYLTTNRKPTKAPFMVLGYNTTEAARKELKAGLHQQDFSCRPQIVEKTANPLYYDLIQKFESASGVSGLLNTSFNIHGYPIVNGPDDALWTLENSDLDAVQIGNYLVSSK